jgi:hypothetical protein
VAAEGAGPRNVVWTVRGPGSIAQDTGVYRAPQVVQRVEVTVLAVDPDDASIQASHTFSVDPAVLAVEGGTLFLGDAADGKGPGFAPAPASDSKSGPARSALEVTLLPKDATHVIDAAPLAFTAAVEGVAEQPAWVFRIKEAEQLGPVQCGQMLQDEQGQWSYHPPLLVLGREVFTFQAFAQGRPELFGETTVAVTNGTLFGKVMNAFDPHWLAPRMVHFSGDPFQAGKASGTSLESRFGSLRGLVKLSRHAPKGMEGRWLAADNLNHAIVVVEEDGSSRVWLGGKGAGRKDGKAEKARFKRPIHLAIPPACQEGREPWRCIIVDSGNHVLRQVGGDRRGFEAWKKQSGRGTGTGRMAGEACLADPHGLAFQRGHLFIWDSGNNTVRVWNPVTGDLSTLLGEHLFTGTYPSSSPNRLGPIRNGRDSLPAGQQAAVNGPRLIAFDQEGRCLLVMRTWLAEVTVDWKALPGHGAGDTKSLFVSRIPGGDTEKASESRAQWSATEYLGDPGRRAPESKAGRGGAARFQAMPDFHPSGYATDPAVSAALALVAAAQDQALGEGLALLDLPGLPDQATAGMGPGATAYVQARAALRTALTAVVGADLASTTTDQDAEPLTEDGLAELVRNIVDLEMGSL